MKIKFKAPSDIRPTAGKVRAAIFNILRSEFGNFEALHCLDLYAGSGALGLTALEEGAESLLAIDLSYDSVKAIKENAQKLRFEQKVKVIKDDCLGHKFDPEQKFNLVFADPPYKIISKDLKHLIELVPKVLAENGLFVLELSSSAKLDGAQEGLELLSKRVYGGTGVWFFKRNF
jgi:16S rRNA (guanine966-N2)-methyltransferase